MVLAYSVFQHLYLTNKRLAFTLVLYYLLRGNVLQTQVVRFGLVGPTLNIGTPTQPRPNLPRHIPDYLLSKLEKEVC